MPKVDDMEEIPITYHDHINYHDIVSKGISVTTASDH